MRTLLKSEEGEVSLDLSNVEEAITIDTEKALDINITGDLGEQNLTVNAPNANVTYNGTTEGTVTINDVSDSSFTFGDNASATSITFADTNGGRLEVAEGAEAPNVNLTDGANATLDGTFETINASGAVEVNLQENTSVANLVASADSAVTVGGAESASVTTTGAGEVTSAEDSAVAVEEASEVTYEATGDVTDISSEVTYTNGSFVVPTNVNNFAFTDGDLEVTATLEDGEWTFTTDAEPVVPAAPTGLEGTAPTEEDGNDGAITGLDESVTYEYQTEGADEWTTVTEKSSEISELEAGNYQVRVAEDEETPAGIAADVTVPDYTDETAPTAANEDDGVVVNSQDGDQQLSEDETITLTFSEPIENSEGEAVDVIEEALADTVFDENVSVTAENEGEDSASFTLTAVEDVNFSENQTITLDAGVITDANGVENEEIVFTVEAEELA